MKNHLYGIIGFFASYAYHHLNVVLLSPTQVSQLVQIIVSAVTGLLSVMLSKLLDRYLTKQPPAPGPHL